MSERKGGASGQWMLCVGGTHAGEWHQVPIGCRKLELAGSAPIDWTQVPMADADQLTLTITKSLYVVTDYHFGPEEPETLVLRPGNWSARDMFLELVRGYTAPSD